MGGAHHIGHRRWPRPGRGQAFFDDPHRPRPHRRELFSAHGHQGLLLLGTQPGLGRVYGAEPGEEAGPEPGREYRELVGGPLDGQLLDVTGWDADMLECGATLITNLGHYGGGGRAHYEPRPGDPDR